MPANDAGPAELADQRALDGALGTPTRARSPGGKEGHDAQTTPPYKTGSPSATSPHSPRSGDAPVRACGYGDVRGFGGDARFSSGGHVGVASGKHARPGWRVHDTRASYERADQRHGKGPALLDEHTRLAIARTQLASTEMQLRVEGRRFEVAQVQLQVQAEKTATAKAQLAVEKARRQIRQLDIELELKQAAAATAKSERDAARDVARLVDLDKQAAISQLKREAAQLQLDAQHERAVSVADVASSSGRRWPGRARAYIRLQQARLRNKTTPKTTADVDAALVDLGVLQPRADPQWQCEFNCGFSTDDQTELAEHHSECRTDDRGFTRAWETGLWECDLCDFEVSAVDFGGAAAEAHLKECRCTRRPRELASDADDGQAQAYLSKLRAYKDGVEIRQGSRQNGARKQRRLAQKEGQTATKK